VLLNGGTSQGAEVIAGCLQDYKRAVLVGERSRGNGGVQSRVPLNGRSVILTAALFVTPAGRTWHKFGEAFGESDNWGIRPDKGYEVVLEPRDREELHEVLRNQEIIPRPGRPERLSDFH